MSWRRGVVIALILTIALVSAALLGARLSTEQGNTPNDQFFYVSLTDPLHIDAGEWRLTVNGTVDRPYTISFDELLGMPNVTVNATLRCVDGPSGRAEFTGVRLSYLLEAAGVRPEAVKVAFRSPDGFSTDLRLEDAMAEDVILAYRMNNETMPEDQGFPVKLVVPSQWGYKWAKWVTNIEVVDYDFKGYWESRGWADQAPVELRSDWWWHAFGLSLAAVIGGFSAVTGALGSRRRRGGKGELIPLSYHRASGYLYIILLLTIFTWWAVETFSLRTAVLYSIHGLLGLTALVLGSFGTLAGVQLFRRSEEARGWHWFMAVVGYAALLVTILIGLSLAY